ncbi:hypothetical protein [Streptomyces sp. NPDC001530]|uniref:hypothetical protein n=1 Tax=Streptomyces sp. NPDC001530 TaxID=3364582 RepID=UPI003697AA87
MGIASVRLSPRKPTVIYLDSHVGLSQGKNYPMTWHALDRLLPYAEPGVQVNGVIGLRISAIRGNDLHLTLAETESHLIIRGIAEPGWGDYLDDRWESLAKEGYPPLWRSPTLTDHERQDEQSHTSVRGTEKDIAWLGSGLLRRIALFHTSSSAYSTRSWITGDEWIFELDTRYEVRLDHDTLLSRLTDPVWGLPLRISEYHCTCDDLPLESDRYMRQCTYELAHSADLPCGLQLRFRWGRAAYGDEAREQLERLGADPNWLEQVIPVGGRHSRGEVSS